MGTVAPNFGPFTDVFTIGALAARVKRKINEPMGPDRIADLYEDINDAIESIWMSAILASLSKFIKGPVNQVIQSGTNTTNLVSVADPTVGPVVTPATAPIGEQIRPLYVSYCLVTDSGSTTLLSPLTATSNLGLTSVAQVKLPAMEPIQGVIGYYVFMGANADGSDQGQQSSLVLWGQAWTEPPNYFTPYPASGQPPTENTTGDNIFAINRFDVQNIDSTWTNWIQTNIGSSFFTEFGHKVPTTTTWQPFVYDLIDNRQLTYRPGPNYTLTGTYFYINKPRRLRFPQSRLPFTSFACHGFLFAYTMQIQLMGLYELEAAAGWGTLAQQERQRIMLQLTQASQNRDSTVRPFMR